MHNQKKIDTLKSKISAIDERMKALLSQKKECEKQLQDIEHQEIIDAVYGNDLNISTLNDDLQVANLIHRYNLNVGDVIELIKDLGGQNHGDSKKSETEKIS